MNDEKYMFFTERIQNTLIKPEILGMMKDNNTKSPGKQADLKQQMEEKK